MKAIIVAGGTPPTKELLTQELTKKSIIIAVDSGADCLWRYKITPHYLLGDFDSISPKILDFWLSKNIPTTCYAPEKDFTDTELALKKACELKVKEITFLGCLGGKRVDHLLGALGLLNECLDLNITASLKDEQQIISILKQSTMIHGETGAMFSLQAYGGTVKKLSITGSKYTLKNYSLKVGSSLTLSNEFQNKNKRVTIKFSSGRLLLITINVSSTP